MRLLTKFPIPLPSFVLVVNAIVGLGEVAHTIPLAVIGAPPSDTIVPPLTAVLGATLLKLCVVMFPVFTVDHTGTSVEPRLRYCPDDPAGRTVQAAPFQYNRSPVELP